MPQRLDSNIQRVLDANFNRAKEGLRVCEDVCRFVYDQGRWAKAFKDLRHGVSEMMENRQLKKMILARDIERDVGRSSTVLEMRRKTIDDVFFANLQRVKESLRVLEEFSKLSPKKHAEGFKIFRYRIYHLERAIMKKG